LRINPNDVTALCRRGFSRLILNTDLDDARRDLEKAFELCPQMRDPLKPLVEAASGYPTSNASD
jgi:hypothetical protein